MAHLPFLDASSVVNVQRMGTVIEPRLERRLGKLPAEMMAQAKAALRFVLDL